MGDPQATMVEKNLMYMWDGERYFLVRDSLITNDYEHTLATTFADVDGDGLLDLASVGLTSANVYQNRGLETTWVDAASIALSAALTHDDYGELAGDISCRALAFGDFDEDGDQDMVVR